MDYLIWSITNQQWWATDGLVGNLDAATRYGEEEAEAAVVIANKDRVTACLIPESAVDY
jgi:hypothetical protein